MKRAIILSTIGFFLLVASCNKYPKYCRGGMKYEFDMPVSVNPGNDTIQLGDTLWVELRVDNPILNKVDGKTYDISKADLYLFFTVEDLLLPTVISTANCYRLNEYGNIDIDGDDAYNVVLKKDNGQCYWKCGVIFTQKGLYMISFNDFIDRSHKPNITECPYEEVKFNYSYNGGFSADDKNYYFLQYSHDENVRSWSGWQYGQSSNYAICVN